MPVNFFSEADLKTFKEMYDKHEPLSEIGKVIGRSEVSLTQKARNMGWKRNLHTVRMVSVYGADILKYGKEPAQISAALEEARIAALKKKWADAAERRRQAIIWFKENIKTKPRAEALLIAYEKGAQLLDLSKELGLTKQAISYLIIGERKKCQAERTRR